MGVLQDKIFHGNPFVAEVLGFQTGGVRDRYERPNVFDPVATKENITKLLKLYGELIDALRTGNTDKFLSAEFQAQLENALVPLRASYQTARTRLRENLIRRGVTDPVAQERLMADLERQEGSNVAQTGRFMVGQKGDFIRQLLSLGTQFTGQQQHAWVNEEHYRQEYDVAREMELQAKRSQNAAQARKYISMMGGGGGMDFMGGGGGFTPASSFGLGAGGGGGQSGYNPIQDSITYGGYMEA